MTKRNRSPFHRHSNPATTAPASRPPRGSAENPIRPRRRRPWITTTDNKGRFVSEQMAESHYEGARNRKKS